MRYMGDVSQSYDENMTMNMYMWCLSLGRTVVVTKDRVDVWMLLLWELYDDEENIAGRNMWQVVGWLAMAS